MSHEGWFGIRLWKGFSSLFPILEKQESNIFRHFSLLHSGRKNNRNNKYLIRSLFYTVSICIKWVKTSWTYRIYRLRQGIVLFLSKNFVLNSMTIIQGKKRIYYRWFFYSSCLHLIRKNVKKIFKYNAFCFRHNIMSAFFLEK